MSEKDIANINAILEAAQKTRIYTSQLSDADEFYNDEKTFDATLMNFVIIGETVAKISEGIKLKNGHIPWIKIKDFRNIIAHNYFGVDAEEVWQIIQKFIPALIADLEQILRKE